MLGQHAASAELIPQMHGMADARRENDSRAMFSEFVPMLDDVADELALVHALGKLPLDVIAALDCNPGQIGPKGRINFGADKVFIADQLGDRRPLDQHLEHVTKATTVTSAWRRGDADDDGIRVGVQQIAVCARRGMVRLIDKDDLRLGQLDHR